MKSILVLLLVAFCAYSFATVYFKETFDGDWESRWKHSGHHKESEQGKLEHTAGKWFGDAEINKGIQTSEDNRFYAITSEFKPFSNKGKDLVLQYDVKFEQKIDCGGGYLKFGPDIEQEKFHGETVYNIMFGPDFCGYSTKKVHVIFNYKGKNHLIKKDIKPKEDQLTHVYTLVVHPDNTYEVFIDLEEAAKGSITEDWDVLAPKTIKDPSAKKPADWVDESDMPDPTDTKPDGWDDVPKQIRDPEATQPEDWDSDLDGDWEAPLIDNPEYKGDWKAKRIPNPNYKGPWIHQQFLILIMLKIQIFMNMMISHMLVLMYGKLNLEPSLIIYLLEMILKKQKNSLQQLGEQLKMVKRLLLMKLIKKKKLKLQNMNMNMI